MNEGDPRTRSHSERPNNKMPTGNRRPGVSVSTPRRQNMQPQSFRTGDGWFAYNLATNLAQTA